MKAGVYIALTGLYFINKFGLYVKYTCIKDTISNVDFNKAEDQVGEMSGLQSSVFLSLKGSTSTFLM